MFQYTLADIRVQLDALPILFEVWFAWMGLIILLAPFAFWRHRQGKVAALFSIAFIPVQLILLHAAGISYSISFLHLILWGPLLYYLVRELKNRRIEISSAIGAWSLVAVATLIVSLVFDLRDAFRWLAGERGIISPGPGIYLPWITVPAMAAALATATWYVFAPRATVRGD
jgi:hypothetical protein